MLKILDTQMEHLAALAQAEFVVHMRSFLRQRHPDRCLPMSDEALTATIVQGMSRARSYGIEIARDVQRYIDLMFQLGLDFDRDVDWAHAILNRPDFSGQIRIDVLCASHEGRIPEHPGDGPFFP